LCHRSCIQSTLLEEELHNHSFELEHSTLVLVLEHSTLVLELEHSMLVLDLACSMLVLEHSKQQLSLLSTLQTNHHRRKLALPSLHTTWPKGLVVRRNLPMQLNRS